MEACGWNDDFWEEIGLGDLVDGHHAKIGRSVAFPGNPLFWSDISCCEGKIFCTEDFILISSGAPLRSINLYAAGLTSAAYTFV
ncbi:hypothetical protein M0R45_019103 [Rubus argutus]|uniref:Uncharacterized protein n=1 Tax=Rubus argutus TaxID=59490 RepID=A0AAW1X700_RUBAR